MSRSSTRYGPIGSSAASFSGPVRKWRKAWVPLAGVRGAGSGCGGPASRDNKVVLFKWTPASGGSGWSGASGGMEPAVTRRRYVPVRPPRSEFRVLLCCGLFVLLGWFDLGLQFDRLDVLGLLVDSILRPNLG
jgi:hypothetical protein